MSQNSLTYLLTDILAYLLGGLITRQADTIEGWIRVHGAVEVKVSTVFGLIDVCAKISMECCCLAMEIPTREVFHIPGVRYINLFVIRVDGPQQSGHDEKLRVVPGMISLGFLMHKALTSRVNDHLLRLDAVLPNQQNVQHCSFETF